MEYATKPGYSYTKDPKLITGLVKGALYLTLVLVLVALFASIMLAYTSYHVPLDRYKLIAEARRVDVLHDVTLCLYIVTSIIFLRWVFVVDSNCHGFNPTGMTISPGWAAGWYFIPFMNLVKPFQAMSEIRRVSTDPDNWLALRAGWLLGIWWTVWLVSGLIGRIAAASLHDAHTIFAFRVAVDWQIADRSIEVVAFVIAITLVYDITRRQQNLVANGVKALADPVNI